MDPNPLAALFFAKENPPPPNTYLKKTLVPSPIIQNIWPDFKVFTKKPLAGLVSTSINDENDQTLHAPTQDSYFGDDLMEDDDILWNLEGQQQKEESYDNTPSREVTVTVLVKSASVSINGIDYALNSTVRASTRIPGGAGAEDSLLLSLKSGFLLLIRIWRVPRRLNDRKKLLETQSTTSHVFRPFCVQWWDASESNGLEASGKELHSHASGMAVVSTSASSVFRIHMCQPTETGIQLSPHFNVPVDGVILHSCFAQPLDKSAGDNHLMFLTLTFSEQRRLELSLYNWYVSDSINNNLAKCTLPLNSTFPVPVMIAPLAKNGSFLFVGADQLTIITAHNITSADYSFLKFAYDGSFPTAFYIPDSPILSFEDASTDEVLLASDSGVIYSIIVENGTSLIIQPIARIGDPISVFTFRRITGKGFLLNFASDTAGAKELLISSLFTKDYLSSLGPGQKIGYSDAELKHDYRNWAPIVDVRVIDSYKSRNIEPYCSQELWALTGIGKRTKLTQLRSGYRAKKETSTYEFLRKCADLFLLTISESQFFVCSMPFQTKVLQYQETCLDTEPEENASKSSHDDVLVDIEDPMLYLNDITLCISTIPNTDTAVQFTPSTVTFSNLQQMKTAHLLYEILFACVVESLAFLIIEKPNNGLEFQVVKLTQYEDFESDACLLDSQSYMSVSHPLNEQVSAMKAFATSSGKILVFITTFSSHLMVAEMSPQNWDSPLSLKSRYDLSEVKNAKDERKSNPVVGHDIVYSEFHGLVFVGCFLGEFIQVQLDEGSDTLALKPSKCYDLGTTPVRLELCGLDPNFLFVHLRNIWMFNFYMSGNPVQVLFEERTERAVFKMTALATKEDQFLRFAFVREDGLTIASVFTHQEPVTKQISIGDSAKKLVFLDNLALFALLCHSKDATSRVKFADRKTNRILPVIEIESRLGQQRKEPIFQQNEIPMCAFVWQIQRQDRVSKKLIVGTLINDQAGSLKVLDVAKVSADTTVIKLVELISIPRDEPVTCIEQVESTILFSCGCKIYSTSYSLEDRKLRPVTKLATLSSPIVSILVNEENSILVSTRMDSLLVFLYASGAEYQTPDPDAMEQDNESSETLSVVFKDPVSRSIVNHSHICETLVAGDKLHSSLIIIDPKRASLKNQFMFKMSVIPRVLITHSRGFWSQDDRKYILTVGVNGEVSAFDPTNDKEERILDMRKRLIEGGVVPHLQVLAASDGEPFQFLREHLSRPFLDKVTGKGFYAIYRLFFDYQENQGKVIDCDLEELAHVSPGDIMI